MFYYYLAKQIILILLCWVFSPLPNYPVLNCTHCIWLCWFLITGLIAQRESYFFFLLSLLSYFSSGKVISSQASTEAILQRQDESTLFLDFFFFLGKTPNQVVLLINKFSPLTWGVCTSCYKNMFLIIFNKTKAYCWVKKVIASYYQWKWYWKRNQLAQFYRNSPYFLFSCNLENNCHTEFFSSKQKCLNLDKLIKGLWIIQINYVSVLEHQLQMAIHWFFSSLDPTQALHEIWNYFQFSFHDTGFSLLFFFFFH